MSKTPPNKSYYGRSTFEGCDRNTNQWPEWPENIAPLPYYPTLRRALRSHGAAVLLVYFEVFHWNDPHIDLATVQRILQITKRNWWWIANAICTRYSNQSHLRAAQLARREFVKDMVGVHGLVMPYSLSGLDYGPKNCILRRNPTALDRLLAKAGVTAEQIRSDAARLKPRPSKNASVKSTYLAPASLSSPLPIDAANSAVDAIEKMLPQAHASQRKPQT